MFVKSLQVIVVLREEIGKKCSVLFDQVVRGNTDFSKVYNFPEVILCLITE